LGDKFKICIVSSTGVITKEPAEEVKIIKPLLYGGINYNYGLSSNAKATGWNYLEGTMLETEIINNIFIKKKLSPVFITGDSATEWSFKNMAQESTFLHISTHGFFYPKPAKRTLIPDTTKNHEEDIIAFRGGRIENRFIYFRDNPNPMMRSGLVFAGANQIWQSNYKVSDNDGILTANEVVLLDLHNTHLVVLSACETGLGDIKGSEGVYGLQRAFKMAGVKYIIMSLWQVPDKETVEFMELFYKKLLKTKDVRRSFNETQKEMRKKYDPYFWAAFVLVE